MLLFFELTSTALFKKNIKNPLAQGLDIIIGVFSVKAWKDINEHKSTWGYLKNWIYYLAKVALLCDLL